jgi:hypothetical protein
MSDAKPGDWVWRRDEKAAKHGMDIVYPEDDELFIDIDDSAGLKVFQEGLPLLGNLVLGYARTPSNGGGDHWHIKVKLSRKVDDTLERIALQALLGSDRKRELLSWATMDGGKVTCFFEKRPEAPAPKVDVDDKPF